MYRVHELFSPFVHTLNTFVQKGVEKPIFDGPLLKMSSSRFQLNAPFLQNTGLYTRIFENAAIFIRVKHIELAHYDLTFRMYSTYIFKSNR